MSILLNEENFIRKTDLETNQSLTCYDFGSKVGCAQQNYKAFEVFYNFIKETSPVRILEIGTGLGGLTLFLHETCKELNLKTEIRSYDTTMYGEHIIFENTNIRMKYENMFVDEQGLQNYRVVNNELIDFIKGDGVTIVLCDGGQKIEEFNLLAPHLKSGDFILAHDYCQDFNVFESSINKKVWNWCEITLDHIIDVMDNNKIVQYEKEIFNNVAWICAKKQEINV